MNSLSLYTRGFQTYAVSETTGLSEEQLRQAAVTLIHYFNSLTESPQMTVVDSSGRQFELYHDYELIHLEDVKELFALNSTLQALSLLLLVVIVAASLFFGRRLEVYRGLRNGALATLALLAITAMAFVVDFDWMFVTFHLVAFDNPFWQLNPMTDYLIMLFPLGFWQDMSILAAAATGLMAASIYALATLRSRNPRDQHPANPYPTTTDCDV